MGKVQVIQQVVDLVAAPDIGALVFWDTKPEIREDLLDQNFFTFYFVFTGHVLVLMCPF